ncbi:DUF2637 domain-containing protein [Prescottella subtropica]|uniref:DUF2637 domain-containing protein n=1 Tax=Prescottella subtropica TaxID=2545757 RepID=UPI00138707CE|nr:DUF2637 domain-containing protein [Prescottella subtropica]
MPVRSRRESRALKARPRRSRPLSRDTKVFRSAVALTSVICAASFSLSFVALWDLASHIGLPRWITWLFPVAVDGAILMSTVALVYLAKDSTETGKKDRGFFWFAMLFGAAASIYGNAYHAYMNTAPGFDPIVAAGIATIAPLSLLLASHGLLVLARRAGGDMAENAALPPETTIIPSALTEAQTETPAEKLAETPTVESLPAEIPTETTAAVSLPAENQSEIEADNERPQQTVENTPSSFEPTPVRATETETTSWIPAADADVLGMPSTLGTGGRLEKAEAQQLVAAAILNDPDQSIPDLADRIGWGVSTVYRWAQQIRDGKLDVPVAV